MGTPLDLGKVVGSRLYNVTAAPEAALGLEGDWAMNTATGDVYEKTGEAAWTKRGCFRGEKGDTGANGKTPALSINESGHLVAEYA